MLIGTTSDPRQYRADLARNAHDPYFLTLSHASFLAPGDLVRLIQESDGLSPAQGHLARLRQEKMTSLDDELKQRHQATLRIESDLARIEASLAEYRTNPPTYRDHNGSRVVARHTVDRTIMDRINAMDTLAAFKRRIAVVEQQVSLFRILEQRLAGAILTTLMREATPAAPTAPQPVNVVVNFPERLEATIVAMPARKTITEIYRDPAGNIAESVQIEQDA